MKNKYETRITKIAHCVENDYLESERTTMVEIVEDDIDGEYAEVVVLTQFADPSSKIYILPEEWTRLRGIIDDMIALCRTKPKGKSNE